MEFIESKTYLNLARSFAGESQAGMRYQMIAKMAFQQGYKSLSDEIRKIAKNETNHAKVFFDLIIENAGNQPNIEVCGGFPFESGTIEDGLKFALDGENAENTIIYPEFRDIAKLEGYEKIASVYQMILDIEGKHKIIFEHFYNAFKDDNLYKNTKPTVWRCANCGFSVTSKEAFNICPLCKASQGYIDLHVPFN